MTLARPAAMCAALVCFAASARADAVSDFYAGKTITVVVGSEAGGGYDAMAHLVAHRIGNYIPGHPNLVVQAMPGAASINAANFLYNTAPRDGTFFGMIQRTLLSANLTRQPGARFDVQKFNWVGNLSSEVPLLLSWRASPVKTVADLFRQEMTMGGGGPSSDSEVQARLLNTLIGTKIKIISGYPGQSQIQLAMERGEVEGVGGWSLSNLKARNPSWLQDHSVNFLLQGAEKRQPELPDTPTPFEFAKTASDRAVLELFYAQQEIARPFVAPPGFPAARLEALRAAFDAVVKDKDFLAEAEKARIDIDAGGHGAIERVVSIISATPPDVAARFAGINNAPM
jgi:tripartite-type tricarboxylate transporter receptor subunit TctC